MVKKDINKFYIKDLVDGDVFALKIDSKEYAEYNGRYLILIYTVVNKPHWEADESIFLCRAKITKNSVLPTTLEEIDKLEYIKTGYASYRREHNIFPLETEHLVPDSFHLIYKYIFEILVSKKIPKSLQYLGNFSLKLPENEYVPDSLYRGVARGIFKNIFYKLLSKYEDNNLHQNSIFSDEFQKNYWERENKNIENDNKIRKSMQELIESYSNGTLTRGVDFDHEIRVNDSETYVGGDED